MKELLSLESHIMKKTIGIFVGFDVANRLAAGDTFVEDPRFCNMAAGLNRISPKVSEASYAEGFRFHVDLLARSGRLLWRCVVHYVANLCVTR